MGTSAARPNLGTLPQRRGAPVTVVEAEPHLCTPAARLIALSSNELFQGLSTEELEALDSLFTSHGFRAGEALYRQGEPARSFFVVVDGAVRVVRVSPSGRQTLLDVRASGDTLGLPTAGHKDVYPDSGWALTSVCALTLEVDQFKKVLAQHPSVAIAALEATTNQLSRAQISLHNLAASTLKPRLAATLLLLAKRLGKLREDDVLIDVPLSRGHLAAMCASSPESVSRLLTEWRKAGWVTTGRKWVAIRDQQALEQLAAQE